MADKTPTPDQPSQPDDNLIGPGLTPEQRAEMARRAQAARDALDPNKPAPHSGLDNAIRDKRGEKIKPRPDDPNYVPYKQGDPLPDVTVNPDFALPKKPKKKLSAKEQAERASRQFVINRKYLEDYVRANGNMSVARRSSVVAYALRHLGYSAEDAKSIALDAPLNAGMYNDGAIYAALQYADSISRAPAGAPGDLLRSSLQPDVIQMPPAARRALTEYRQSATPASRKVKDNLFNRLKYASSAISSIIKPASDRIGNLPVPGGISGLLAINLLFLGAIVPVTPQGYTRLELLWLTLLNRTQLPGLFEKKAAPASPIVQAAFNAAEGIKEVAVAAGSLGQHAQDISNLVQSADTPISRAILGGVIGGVLNPSAGSVYIPPSSTGSVPPPAPLPPSPPPTVAL